MELRDLHKERKLGELKNPILVSPNLIINPGLSTNLSSIHNYMGELEKLTSFRDSLQLNLVDSSKIRVLESPKMLLPEVHKVKIQEFGQMEFPKMSDKGSSSLLRRSLE